MGNLCASRFSRPNNNSVVLRLDAQSGRSHDTFCDLPTGAWWSVLSFGNASHAMLLRTISKSMVMRVQSSGACVKSAEVNPFLGGTCTAKCVERFSEIFPQLQCLSVSVYTRIPHARTVLNWMASEVGVPSLRDVADDGDGIALVMPQIVKLCNLQSLDFLFTASEPVALMQISSLVGLKNLWLNGPIPDQLLQAIGQNCPQLELLSLHAKEHSGDEGLVAIAEGCRLLQNLELVQFGCSDHTVSKVVRGCVSVEIINMDVRGETLYSLAANAHLKSLTLGERRNLPEGHLAHLIQSSVTLEDLTVWDCDTYVWFDPPSSSIRHLELQEQRFLYDQFAALANWANLERLNFMFFGDTHWATCALDALIEAAPSLQSLRRVDWIPDVPDDKRKEFAARLRPCALYVDDNLVPSTLSTEIPPENPRGSTTSDEPPSKHTCSMLVEKILDDPSSSVVCPQYFGAEGEEPPAHVTPEEASNASSELWASGVEHLIQGSSHSAPRHGQSESRVVLLTFGRFPEQMRDAVLQSKIATHLLDQGCDIRPSWANGSYVLAADVDENHVSEARDKWHIAVHEAHEKEIYEAIERLPYNIRPRIKPGCRFPIPENATFFGDVSTESSGDSSGQSINGRDREHETGDTFTDDGVEENETSAIEIRRTFLHIPPPLLAPLSPRTSKTV